jgi:hypothetical protein
MNHNPVSCEELVINQDADLQVDPTTDSRPWRRPLITILDVKRTMLDVGAYTDGIFSTV